ncbi:HepT-like ribonuclease domain-containing protein [Amycolatopsis thermoflava]|uniref:HepT-like ribonuclease domain-containing protein n=1 Tax=Amycolatopsis thermoflava TaxID=84480 RepID=UPI003646D1A6
MTRRRRKDSQHLADARDHLRVLQEHLARGSLADTLIRDAVSHRLEVAVDAVGKVSPSLLEAEAPEDWPRIVGMRNMLAHQYADLDQEILQNTIDKRLPDLIRLVDRLHELAVSRER